MATANAPISVTPSGYLANVIQRSMKVNVPWPEHQVPGVRPKVVYHSSTGGTKLSIASPEALVAIADDVHQQRVAVCVIENITPGWIEVLGTAWDIDPDFFVGHAFNPREEDHWTPQTKHIWSHQSSVRPQPRPFCNLLDLILTDPPDSAHHQIVPYYPLRQSTLRLPYAAKSGGIVIAGLYEQEHFSLTVCFINFLAHPWHLEVLFGQPAALPVLPFLYLLSNSIWISNLRHLDSEIKRVSYVEIRNPDQKINDRLHDLRGDLADFRARVAETNTYIPLVLADHYDDFPIIKNRHHQSFYSPAENHQVLLDQAAKLESLLMDTFQIPMSSLNVRDSQINIEQARRGTLVAYLAFFYIPLAFVTGVFGMNIKEINGSPLSIWVCVVTLAVTIAVTAAGFLFYRSRLLVARTAKRGRTFLMAVYDSARVTRLTS
ncbi:hypothetical protein LTR91_003625 [Friedmanniomyces endolithicus]|uniref:Uncharacterized protein n=1 Tax=Friedmanniomyces endolithicus TaxID=329885 RepID=A0AAN6F616_9PEZI|nr:hypothetical protein LTR35_001351 [Friedmanniomyces endolithicus]KAK0297837.1 hypothetical protein LTS00_003375 [Friedmanniomyces endolithicus]KAK0303001.1 hypothetical protein LTR82_017688 [Friedmanniomyces endolithicus]KAK0309926.1 hypothetical protein LTR01_004124 [Friedmanniomyces endolithicus]KAK0826523.1 hypothetical protein LTR73_006388 [Friedmanniomyces endolithicus]